MAIVPSIAPPAELAKLPPRHARPHSARLCPPGLRWRLERYELGVGVGVRGRGKARGRGRGRARVRARVRVRVRVGVMVEVRVGVRVGVRLRVRILPGLGWRLELPSNPLTHGLEVKRVTPTRVRARGQPKG